MHVPEKFVILQARTLYFGICSSIRENISTSSMSVLERSWKWNVQKERRKKIKESCLMHYIELC